METANESKCGLCQRRVERWRERPQYGSRELIWYGCRRGPHDPILAGGVNDGAAYQNWKREEGRAQRPRTLLQ